MVTVRWCLQKNGGLELVEPNSTMAGSYIKMAEESIDALQNLEKSRLWTAVTAYYIFYYSLYSLMMRLGVKCEIHSCSLEFMKQYLRLFYNSEDVAMTENFIKTKDALARATEKQLQQVREDLRKEIGMIGKRG